MTEGVKTLVFACVAAVAALAAVLSRPVPETVNIQSEVGKMLFPDFDDPAKAASMEITQYNQELGSLGNFKVARDKGTGAWTIPSHAGYPADAETRLRDAALLLVDLKILGVPTEVAGEHKLFGVVEPNREKLQVGDEGVGLLVNFEDAKGDLASLIIGNKVRGAEDQRFVRKSGQDVVYAVKIDPDKLSTKFVDWIEKDLLKLNAWDIENVTINNYSVARQLDRVSLDKKFDVSVAWKDNEWKLDSLTRYRENQPVASVLAENEELNKDKLNDFKTALDNLEIIDVERKPKGLGADLKAGEGFAKDEEGMVDLINRGFYIVPSANNELELLSANGEIHVVMKDGVEYILRFGEAVNLGDGQDEDGQNRYLFVTTRVDMNKFPPPELEPLPDLPAGSPASKAAPETSATSTTPSSSQEDSSAATAEAKPAAAPAPPETDSPPKAGEPGAASPADAKPAEGKPDASGTADGKPAGGDQEAAEAKIEQERERINKENQRKIDERNEKLQKAKERVAELNTRFADWYYVVSDKEFRKIQLNLSDVIKQKESSTATSGEGEGVEDFRKLQTEGMKKPTGEP